MSDSTDDPIGIPNSTRLFRRISPVWVVYDKNRGEQRPTSQNFQNSRDDTGMSDSDDVHPSHAAVAGEKPSKIRSKLGQRFEWVVAPPSGLLSGFWTYPTHDC